MRPQADIGSTSHAASAHTQLHAGRIAWPRRGTPNTDRTMLGPHNNGHPLVDDLLGIVAVPTLSRHCVAMQMGAMLGPTVPGATRSTDSSAESHIQNFMSASTPCTSKHRHLVDKLLGVTHGVALRVALHVLHQLQPRRHGRLLGVQAPLAQLLPHLLDLRGATQKTGVDDWWQTQSRKGCFGAGPRLPSSSCVSSICGRIADGLW